MALKNGTRYPTARIAKGQTEAVVYLPDPARGYYRGPRFDWSALVASLRCGGHEVFGEWKPGPHDPLGNDWIVGPACEFGMGPSTGNPPPPGYDAARPRGTFLKIGVGELRKPDAQPYHFGRPYEIVRPAPWRVLAGDSWMEFHQDASLGSWAYRYQKRLEIPAEGNGMRITYRLENTGRRPLRQAWYCHNFIRIDEHPIGTAYRLDLPFQPRFARAEGAAVAAHGRSVQFVRDLGPKEGVFAVIEGYGDSAKDNEVTVRCSSVGVKITGSMRVTRFHLFATRLTVCPELFISFDLAPGRSVEWKDRYLPEPGEAGRL